MKIHPNVRSVLQDRIEAAVGRELDFSLSQWAQVLEVLFPEDYLPRHRKPAPAREKLMLRTMKGRC